MEELLNGANAALVSMVVMLTLVVKSVGGPFFDKALGQRLLPLVPLVLAVALSFLGLASPADSVTDKLLVGLLSGLAASASYKVVKTSVLGSGVDKVEPAKVLDKTQLPDSK